MAASSSSSSNQEELNEGDDMLAHHGPMIYQGKVLKKEKRAGKDGGADEVQYFVHYQGWNKKWDEWILRDRMMPLNEESLKVQKEHNAKKRKTEQEAKDKKKEAELKAGGGAANAKKRKIDTTRELEDDAGEAVVKLPIPFGLKKQLVDDWEYVTREPRHLVSLPRTPTVTALLSDYVESKRRKAPTQVANFQEVCDGVKLYFDRALGTILLYHHEREQYDEARQAHPDTPMSDIYGAEHLLRLFVRLPYLLAQTDLDEAEMAQIQAKLGDLLKYMQKQQSTLFLSEYARVQPAAAGGAAASSSSSSAGAAPAPVGAT